MADRNDLEMSVGRPRTLNQRLDHVEDQLDKLTARINLLFGALGAVGAAVTLAQFLSIR